MTLLLFYMPNHRVITLLYSAYRADQRLNMVSSLFPKPGSIVGHFTFLFFLLRLIIGQKSHKLAFCSCWGGRGERVFFLFSFFPLLPFFCLCSLLACRYGLFHILFLKISKYPLTLMVHRNVLFTRRSLAKDMYLLYWKRMVDWYGMLPCMCFHLDCF